jgi:7,8-dihydropterin-6-yl-methyl-4-(beta-D-ribofuranosyl)aminobenzene 5'-phosphate synthase
MLVLEDEDGLVLLTGCSHHGVLNMVETARRAFPGRPIKALVGGFHFVGIPVMGLFGDNAKAIREVAEQLRAAAIPRILTMHCTERSGYERLRQVIGPTVEYAGVRCSIH